DADDADATAAGLPDASPEADPASVWAPPDLVRAAAELAGDDRTIWRADWPRNPRALAGRLRRAQTFLRMLGIESRSVVKDEPAAG
ncbi:MAG TPA: hypothetical protein VEW06_06125, partial [Xanthobacteraceae bacterium]|nr:hypothetical protein [Xanthobacteraceae bacterium]